MKNNMTLDELIDAKYAARQRRDDKTLNRLERRENRAETMIGTLCRMGREVCYIFPQGGSYREGGKLELIAFLIRNNYA